MHVENAADSRHHLDRGEARLELFEDLRRQTDGVLARPSGDAVLDANVDGVGHEAMLPVAQIEEPEVLGVARRLRIALEVRAVLQEALANRHVVLTRLEVLLHDVAFMRRHARLLLGTFEVVPVPP
jgi:hypothetical protein